MRPEAIRARPMSTRTMPASVSGRASAPVRGRVRVTWVPATLVGAVVTVVSGVEVTVVPSTCSVVVVDGTVMVVELTLVVVVDGTLRSEEHTSELQSLMRSSYAVFCLTKKQKKLQSLLLSIT